MKVKTYYPRSTCWPALSMMAAAFISAGSIAVASEARASTPGGTISEKSKAVRDKIDLHAPDGCSHINGFNYQPSWGHNGLTVWGEKFDAKTYREQLAAGKKYFPKFNAVRVWLSWSAYRENPQRFVRNFQQAVDVCAELDLLVFPVLFNRWIGTPQWDRVQNVEIHADFEKTFGPYIKDVVAPMKGDPRIVVWDLCNEPYLRAKGDKAAPVSNELETQWLENVHRAIKQHDPKALTCVGTIPRMSHIEWTAHLQDILTPHLYYPLYMKEPPNSCPDKLKHSNVIRIGLVEEAFDYAKKLRRPIISTECCWGDMEDGDRVEIIVTNLRALEKYKIAFFPHALWESGVADLHKYDEGLYMPFILKDGTIRSGHGIYNEFAR